MRPHIAAVLVLTCLGSAALATEAPVTNHQRMTLLAIDGDTIAVGKERIRILGLDTPETYQPQCPEEEVLGYQAAGRLQKLLNTRSIRIERIARADKYGRTLGMVYAGEDDVAALLIKEGVARSYTGGKRKSWCAATAEPREALYD